MKKKSILLLIMILIAAGPIFAQFNDIERDQLPNYIGLRVRLRTESGATFQGGLYSVDEEFITIIDRNCQIVIILKDAVEEAQIIDPNPDKKSYYQDSAANRFLVMPTGFPMETGEFHIADQEIAAVTMSYGVNQNFSLWGGISIPGAIVSARFITDIGEKSALSVGTFAGMSWIEFMGLGSDSNCAWNRIPNRGGKIQLGHRRSDAFYD
ncbi:MAG TPA: hypothetical protein DCO79_11310 [Spirochaeta sp.]|nr:hypothetical protein [Spirochaeta sp.]